MASSAKRCLYEVLGLSRDCTAEEIRSAYKKLALQRHPDKLIQSGVSEAEATASFQELVNAYEVLSDSRERAWYDSHRSQILFSSSATSGGGSSSSTVPDLFCFFSNSVFSGYSSSGKGFYKVYSDVFDKIYHTELDFAKKLVVAMPKEAPLMGNLESPYTQYDVLAGPNRKSRRVMEDENKKLRKKARREYNETVRGLAEFVKKRDKRVIDMQLKRNEEMERKKEEERERKKELERARQEKARLYEEQEWAKVNEDDELDNGFDEDVQGNGAKKGDGKEFYCVVCGKKFKSEKQWKNHEQSKKHKDMVAELKDAFGNEERENEVVTEAEGTEGEALGRHQDSNGEDYNTFLSVDELQKQFEGTVKVSGGESDEHGVQSNEEGFVDVNNGSDSREDDIELVSDDDGDEASFLEAMVSGHQNRRNFGKKTFASNSQAEGSSTGENFNMEGGGMDSLQYNNWKVSERNRSGKRERGKNPYDEASRDDLTSADMQTEENSCNGNDLHSEPSSSFHPVMENEIRVNVNNKLGRKLKTTKQTVDPIPSDSRRRDADSKLRNAAKGRKQKGTPKPSGNTCETCGEEFESRNKLHNHLSNTGHAMLKSR